MGHAGARVLNPQAVQLAEAANLDLLARRSFDGEKGRETLVTADTNCPAACAVVELSNVVALTSPAGAREHAIASARQAGFTLSDPQPSGSCWTGWARLDTVNRRLVGQLVKAGFTVSSERSLVSLVDSRLSERHALLQAAHRLAPPSATVVAQKKRRLSVILPHAQAETLMLEWHERLVLGRGALRQSA
jgi:aspartokinase